MARTAAARTTLPSVVLVFLEDPRLMGVFSKNLFVVSEVICKLPPKQVPQNRQAISLYFFALPPVDSPPLVCQLAGVRRYRVQAPGGITVSVSLSYGHCETGQRTGFQVCIIVD